MSSSPLRDNVNNLLLQLAESLDVDVSEHRGSLRQLGVAALNLATEADSQTLAAATQTLPWVGAFIAWQRREMTTDELAGYIADHGLVQRLDAATVRRRLCQAGRANCSSIRRSPQTDQTDDELSATQTEILHQLVADDRRIDELAGVNAADRRDALIDDSGLLAAALQMHAGGAADDAGLDTAIPGWAVQAPATPLEVMAQFERTDFETVPHQWNQLGERPRRFEQSLATHLQRHDVLYAVRAALAFAPRLDDQAPEEIEIQRFLTRFSVFADDPPLLRMALALIRVRHAGVAVLRGAAPLAALSPWVDYLRGDCVEFGESRGITLREATNFAHYALHLIDLCDLSAIGAGAVTEPTRRALMDIEDEVKEFVLVGQQQELTDRQADLHRYETSRFNGDETRAQLADRLARLCGAWRAGHCSGPPGSARRPDDELFDTSLELVAGDDRPLIDAANNLLQHARLLGLESLESWPPARLFPLICRALHAARHSGGFTPGRRFTIDFTPLAQWLTGDDAPRRAELLETLLDLHEPTPDGGNTGLTTHLEDQRLVVDFSPSDQLEALLTLLADARRRDDQQFVDTLQRRLDDHLRSLDDTDDGSQPHEPTPSKVPSVSDKSAPEPGAV